MAGKQPVTGRGDIATALLQAAIDNPGEFPEGQVPDTPENRSLFAEIGQSIKQLPPGVIPDVPYDYSGV